ncbi:hypothetical protein [Aliamphritea ceti]|uniref:hypothetical protein n=1 Tax=Aliamphritea ceti TaxID=1524258 RepID=UPI0021C45140|nr:hypothetical protein [Aliamphritea ceti]
MLNGKRVSLIGIPDTQIPRLTTLYALRDIRIVPYGQATDYIVYGPYLNSIDEIDRGSNPVADIMSQDDFFSLLLRDVN